MTVTLTLTEARATLPSVLDRVAEGEEVIITRHGSPAAVLLHPDRLRVRRAAAEATLARAAEIEQGLERGRQTPLDELPGLSSEHAEELIAHVRWSRRDD